MKHIKLFEDMKQGNFSVVGEYFAIDADNAPAQIAFIKKKAGLDTEMINADYLVRGALSLLDDMVECGLDSSRYGGAIKESIEALKPAIRKIQEIQSK